MTEMSMSFAACVDRPSDRECDCDWKEELQFAGIDFVPCTCERIENNEPL